MTLSPVKSIFPSITYKNAVTHIFPKYSTTKTIRIIFGLLRSPCIDPEITRSCASSLIRCISFVRLPGIAAHLHPSLYSFSPPQLAFSNLALTSLPFTWKQRGTKTLIVQSYYRTCDGQGRFVVFMERTRFF